MPGILETFECCSDTDEQLALAIRILMTWDTTVSHYVTGVDARGKPFLTMRWAAGVNGTPLITPMKDPEAVTAQCIAWLTSLDWTKLPAPDIDGHCRRGWHISQNGACPYNYDVFTIYPAYTEYHK